MEKNNFWGTRAFGTSSKMIVRLVAVTFIVLGGLALAFAFMSTRTAAHASGTITPGPVSSTWYFAEGKVGKGYEESFTLNDPDPANACAVNILYLYTLDNGNQKTLTVAASIPVASRISESVNIDLGIPASQTSGAVVSAVLTVDANQTPACSGVVAERVMAFNHSAINSGTDVMGATRLGTTFYFADVPNGGGYASSFAILNTGSSSATVTVSYYLRGQLLGSAQDTAAAQTRSTVYTSTTPNLPRHMAAIVTSTQPITVERTAYFTNINGGNAGTVSGAWTVIGSQSLATDWIFAEGHTGNHYLENLVISNLDPSNTLAHITITLEYANGTNLPFNITVGAQNQVIWNVKQANTGHFPSVSVEVTSDVNVIADRQMFFSYSATQNSSTITVAGATDTVGQVGPVSQTAYSFAEGNTGTGYFAWMTLLNPTANAETVNVTVVNELGRSFTQAVPLAAHSRFTLDLDKLVQKHLVQSGDGSQAYAIWETAQSTPGAFFVAERIVLQNTTISGLTNPIQAGADVFGYAGA